MAKQNLLFGISLRIKIAALARDWCNHYCALVMIGFANSIEQLSMHKALLKNCSKSSC